MITATDIIRIARCELGTTEKPKNSNKTKYGAWYGLDGNPWCMMFVQWVFAQAGASSLLPTKTASCSALMNAAKDKSCWITSGYLPGDVVIYDFPNTGATTDHCGIVEYVNNSSIDAIEGNTSISNNSNGGEVMRRNRSLNLVYGAVRPKYATETDILIENLTDKQLVRLMERAQTALGKSTVSDVLNSDWNKACERGITYGGNPNAFATRAQTAVMILRSMKS